MARKTTAKPRVSVKLRNLLKRFEAAAVAYSWRGGGHPDDIPAADHPDRDSVKIDATVAAEPARGDGPIPK